MSRIKNNVVHSFDDVEAGSLVLVYPVIRRDQEAHKPCHISAGSEQGDWSRISVL